MNHPKEPSGTEALEGPGNVSAPTLINFFGKGSCPKTTQRSSKTALKEEGEAFNAAKVMDVMVQVIREPLIRVEEAKMNKARGT